ncbi:hypothetical protein [Pseudovibrio sp. Tun.PSC04-5.I4]|uniref:hypothetical protein n=1 Tax=Pseudovibrio sp. Tun.PSC04-5.I4 TaxID=1798213 RepID=UPI00117B42FF|nr:hypothetical protein [Pseudovibrio sp. Tun.PSC04-5.I4]
MSWQKPTIQKSTFSETLPETKTQEVTRPQQSSGMKPFSEVATDGRAFLDQQYEKHGVKNTFQYRDKTGTFRREVFSEFDLMDLDRRMLYAMTNNEGGQFTAEEVRLGESWMEDQIQQVMFGQGSDPTDYQTPIINGIKFLDDMASPEEKASFEWIEARATAQFMYEQDQRDPIRRGKGDDESLSTTNPLVLLLMSAHGEMWEAHKTDMTARLENQSAYKSAYQQWLSQQDSFGEYSLDMLV